MQRLDLLGTLSEEAGRLTRPYASAAMQRAIEMVGRWMRPAGMAVRRDRSAKLWMWLAAFLGPVPLAVLAFIPKARN